MCRRRRCGGWGFRRWGSRGGWRRLLSVTSSILSLTLGQRLSEYEKLMRLDKPIGILLLLWPTLWALWVASDGRPTAWIVAIFVIGTVLMRSAGCGRLRVRSTWPSKSLST